jgi:cell division protein FtsB
MSDEHEHEHEHEYDVNDDHEYEYETYDVEDSATITDLAPPEPVIDDAPEPDAQAGDSAELPVPPRRVAWERPTRIAVASLALIAILFLFVFPTRSYLAQQRQVGAAQNAVQELKIQNTNLAREAKRLRTRSEIERMARVQFNMVFPGEQAYNIVSPDKSATTTTTLP